MQDNNIADNLYFTIKEVSEQVGVVPATIRNWEKAGLFKAHRTKNGYRVFTLQDIEFLKKIKSKSKDESIGLNGIRLLYHLDDNSENKTITALRDVSSDQLASKRLLGSKWRESRISHGYSIEDVSERIGISSSYLYKIENAQANASYEVLLKLAKFYGENILHYMDDSLLTKSVVKKGTSESLSIGIEGLSLEQLIFGTNKILSAFTYTAAPGVEHNDFSSHNGEEFIYILSGKIEFLLDEDKYMLSSGDCISFDSNHPHRWRNISSREAKFIWVYTSAHKL